nr:PREDICTED: rab11 family-interacting protein 1 [Balearica regulorum gibbericeps]
MAVFRWYKLRSKPGKKEKERGEIEVDIQFMRSNMTASMFDLSMKDKSRSPFGKLKDKLKGKRSSGLSDTASAIIPSTTHSPADSEDESVEKEKKKSKFKTLFSKPGLQKTSLSQSMSVLPTQQPVTERVRLRPSDFHSQWDDEESETSSTSEKAFGNALEEKSSLSPVFKSCKTATLDSRQLNQVTTSHTKKEGLSLFSGLKSKNDPVSKSSLCINGSHVYMEESTTKDNTPASSPSPHNFRRKQLFASEENLSSRSAKGPEETGRTSPSHAFSGSASLETFKSMTLPSYKLLSSEEYPETSIPPTVEVIKETKKTDHKKSALLSLVTGKKDAVKTVDAENIPDRTLQNEENKVPEEKSEQEAKGLELPADLSRGNPSEDSHCAEDVFANKQPLNPFEEEWKPEKAAAPAKTKAVKPRLHPVKPMNATANKTQSKNLNVISTMNEKLLEMSVKKYDPSDPAYAYAQLTHDELIQLVLKQKDTITKKDLQVRELEDYIDNLLVRVMEETPNILRVSTSGNKKAGKM